MVNNVASEPIPPVAGKQREYIRDKMLDKTLADSFPTSDPPSSLPDPSVEDSFAEDEAA
jgi:hypothetical protein